MPIYEEKLISPLAVHFTQDHIRTTFRDHRSVEAAVDEIEAEAGNGDYDIILKAPFPHIEILRWQPKRHASDSGSESEGDSDSEYGDEHWFTLDNRRLYCLQRAAAKYWPQRVAAVVEVLYMDPGSVRRKYDSKTNGWAVTIAHSLKGPQLAVWDWRKSVMGSGSSDGICAAVGAVQADDAKETVEKLADAPQQGGLMAMLAAEAQRRAQESAGPRSGTASGVASPKGFKEHAACPTPSTADNSDSSDESAASDPGAACASRAVASKAVARTALAGVWVGNSGETYQIKFSSELRWLCIRNDANGTRKVPLFYETESGLVWWGNEGSFFLDASQAAASPGQLAWYAAGDLQRRRPRFSWLQLDEQDMEVCDYDVKAADAIREILAQLRASGGSTSQLWIEQWVERYQGALGSLRRFIESRPDQFTVTPGKGRQYSVSAVVAYEPPARNVNRSKAKKSEGARISAGPIGTMRASQWTPSVRRTPAGPAYAW